MRSNLSRMLNRPSGSADFLWNFSSLRTAEKRIDKTKIFRLRCEKLQIAQAFGRRDHAAMTGQ